MNAGDETGPDDLISGWEIYNAASVVSGPAAFSRQWRELPVDDVRRRAALVRAAWYWFCAENELTFPAGRRGVEELVEREVSHELRAASRAVAGATDWSAAAADHMYQRTAHRRRAQALRPRPHDHPGGAVDWATGRPVEQRSDAAA